MSNAVTFMVKLVIRFAPSVFLVWFLLPWQPPVSPRCGLRATAGRVGWLYVTGGAGGNPLLVWWKIRRNPFPLVLLCCAKAACMPSSPAALRRTFR